MTNFTEEQLKTLETLYGLKRVNEECLPVRDGYVRKNTMVWWRCSDGPECVRAGDGTHWDNIAEFPGAYQLEEPCMELVYVD